MVTLHPVNRANCIYLFTGKPHSNFYLTGTHEATPHLGIQRSGVVRNNKKVICKTLSIMYYYDYKDFIIIVMYNIKFIVAVPII